MRIIFMGTPDFAVPCLSNLIKNGHDICAVFTQPDKPKGRGYKLTPPPIKKLAEENGINVFQPKTLRTEKSVQIVKSLKPEAIVVVAYGKILPKSILEIPYFGCINVHASLLPKYRGAAPIQWSVLNGDKITGVTTMYMAEGLDTGDIISSKKTNINPDETSGELHDRLSEMGAELIVETLDQIKNGTAKRISQMDEKSCYASMLSKDMSHINWNKTALEIHNLIRGLSPWPVANTKYNNKLLKIHRSQVVKGYNGDPGEIVEAGGNFVVCCLNNTAIELLEVQYEGKKRMSGKNFLLGHPVKEKTIL